jgi:hypothetical protein
MMVLRWLFLALLGVLFTALAMLLAPILPMFVGWDGYLPRWLAWFQTPDNPAHREQMA